MLLMINVQIVLFMYGGGGGGGGRGTHHATFNDGIVDGLFLTQLVFWSANCEM